VVSSSGSLTASTSYDAWGNPETSGGLTSYTPIGFAGGYTDPNGLVYLINRYYDPTTGQFLTVDPLVDETGQAYAYVGDEPVNRSDPSGQYTEGICFEGSVVAGIAVGEAFVVTACLVESNDNQQVGITITSGHSGGLALNPDKLDRFDENPSLGTLATLGLNYSATFGYSASNANTVCDLQGRFVNHSISIGGDTFGGEAAEFTGASADGRVTGVYVGLGLVGGFGFIPAMSTSTKVELLSGDAANFVAGLIDTYTQDPADLLIRSAIRGYLAVAGQASS
jgi:RHS repeat-associated protein